MRSPYRHPVVIAAFVLAALMIAAGVALVVAAPRPKTSVTIHLPSTGQAGTVGTPSHPGQRGATLTPRKADPAGHVETDSIRVRFNVPESKPPATVPGGAPAGTGY